MILAAITRLKVQMALRCILAASALFCLSPASFTQPSIPTPVPALALGVLGLDDVPLGEIQDLAKASTPTSTGPSRQRMGDLTDITERRMQETVSDPVLDFAVQSSRSILASPGGEAVQTETSPPSDDAPSALPKDYQAKMDILATALAETEAARLTLENEVQALRSAMTHARSMADDADTQSQFQTQQITTLQDQNTLLNLELDAMALLLVDRDTQVQNIAREKQLYVDQLSDTRAEVARLAAELDQTAQHLTDAHNRVKDLEGRLSASQDLINQRTHQLEGMTQTLREAQARNDQFEADFVTLSEGLNAAQQALRLAQGTGADTVHLALVGQHGDGDGETALPGLSWAVQPILDAQGTIGQVFMTGKDPRFQLPSQPGTYRISVALGAEQLDYTLSVSPYAVQEHRLDLNLGKLILSALQVDRPDARLLVRRGGSLVYEGAAPQEDFPLYARPGLYEVSLSVGQQWSTQEIELLPGDTVKTQWSLATQQVEFDLVNNTTGAPLPSATTWALSSLDDGNDGDLRIATGTGAKAAMALLPGAYMLNFGHDGVHQTKVFEISQSNDNDNDNDNDIQQLRFSLDIGEIGVDITNANRVFPAGLDVQWSLVDQQGKQVAAGQSTRVQARPIPAGHYSLIANTKNAERRRPVNVVAGQTSLVRLDFALGMARLAIDSPTTDATTWTLQNLDTQHLMVFERAGNTLTEYLPGGTYQIIATHDGRSLHHSLEIFAGQATDLALKIDR